MDRIAQLDLAIDKLIARLALPDTRAEDARNLAVAVGVLLDKTKPTVTRYPGVMYANDKAPKPNH